MNNFWLSNILFRTNTFFTPLSLRVPVFKLVSLIINSVFVDFGSCNNPASNLLSYTFLSGLNLDFSKSSRLKSNCILYGTNISINLNSNFSYSISSLFSFTINFWSMFFFPRWAVPLFYSARRA